VDGLRWRRTRVQGRRAVFGEGGLAHGTDGTDGTDGTVIVFLHGWALSDRTYRRPLGALVRRGHAVLAPALPGFRETAPLPPEDLSLAGYAAWLRDFLDAVGITAPVTLVGHSFGGAVAIACAHAFPDRVGRLVLVNSIGGATWSSTGRPRPMSERPVLDWGVHLGAEALSLRGITHVLPVIAADALTHALTRPRALWRVGRLARESDLTAELETLRRRGTPVVVVWGREDTVLPWACAESLIGALGDPRVVTVRGDHGWLISDPGGFADVLTNVLGLPPGPEDGRAA
jgi:pimeloyl-ACP methyl ester carboxylesterase